MFQPLSAPLQSGLRFFRPPLPATLSAHLTVCFPSAETEGELRVYHVSQCVLNLDDLGSTYTPAALRLREGRPKSLFLTAYLLVQAYQHL